MESRSCSNKLFIVCAVVLLHGTVAFSCCVAAEFVKLKAKDVKMDGSLCSLRRSPAFGLGVAALVCLSIAQIVGTSSLGGTTASCFWRRFSCSPAVAAALEKLPQDRRCQIASTFLFILSWVGYGLAAVPLGTASSMNNAQPSSCYVVHDGVYAGAATLVAAVVVALVITMRMSSSSQHKTRGPDEEEVVLRLAFLFVYLVSRAVALHVYKLIMNPGAISMICRDPKQH